ncbi:hypothetical protein GCM10022403_032790 [Streptomyces coacervatus]|uniref:Uncharacterized protein n=1 Tax=Streptomyces coacervatus TaxID=647381 RepID=A0ABP7HS80_9ACTN
MRQDNDAALGSINSALRHLPSLGTAAATSSCTSSASASATSASKAGYVPASTPSTGAHWKSGKPNQTKDTPNSRETSRATAVRAVELVAVFTAAQEAARRVPVAGAAAGSGGPT